MPGVTTMGMLTLYESQTETAKFATDVKELKYLY